MRKTDWQSPAFQYVENIGITYFAEAPSEADGLSALLSRMRHEPAELNVCLHAFETVLAEGDPGFVIALVSVGFNKDFENKAEECLDYLRHIYHQLYLVAQEISPQNLKPEEAADSV